MNTAILIAMLLTATPSGRVARLSVANRSDAPAKFSAQLVLPGRRTPEIEVVFPYLDSDSIPPGTRVFLPEILPKSDAGIVRVVFMAQTGNTVLVAKTTIPASGAYDCSATLFYTKSGPELFAKCETSNP